MARPIAKIACSQQFFPPGARNPIVPVNDAGVVCEEISGRRLDYHGIAKGRLHKRLAIGPGIFAGIGFGHGQFLCICQTFSLIVNALEMWKTVISSEQNFSPSNPLPVINSRSDMFDQFDEEGIGRGCPEPDVKTMLVALSGSGPYTSYVSLMDQNEKKPLSST